MDPAKFTLRSNGSRKYDLKEFIRRGSYSCLLEDHPFYTGKDTTFEQSHAMFRECFSDGFPWELLDIYGGKS